MSACSKCGGTEKYKSGICKACHRKRMAARRGGEPFRKDPPGRPARKVKFDAQADGPEPQGPGFGSGGPPPVGFSPGAGQGAINFDINFNVDMGGDADGDEDSFLSALNSARDRLGYMMRRHKRTLSAFDQEHDIMNQVLQSMRSLGGTMADLKFFIQLRQDLLKKRADYDLKMSKELQVFSELAAKDDSETPIRVVFPVPDPAQVVRPCIGDAMDLKNLLPSAAGDV